MATFGYLLCAAVIAVLLALSCARPSHFHLDDSGGYRYAYDTGNGIEAEQTANQQNELTGHYSYYDDKGVHHAVKYTAGVRGFQPKILTPSRQRVGTAEAFVRNAIATMHHSRQRPNQLSFHAQHAKRPVLLGLNDLETSRGGAAQQPYKFSYLTDQSARIESADSEGNVIGKYSYYDEAGSHDLAYKAGDGIGYVIVGGSLANAKNDGGPSFADFGDPTKPQLVVTVDKEPFGSYRYAVHASRKNAVPHENRRIQGEF